ncbi:MAG: 30S ribosome-binding factor RbfA [Ardenticatenaceae bacterium]|nr:30S ribosome-binding factor RbfA [Anaerolineales bacterium]MCB8922648.1 30S ribosome-binding factor RbfA [Ardenticatenaceae bacterium]MCB9003644.1 30S ribosome-binding factor RbfA [Ardenticatenaceae bacterium]
MSKVRQQRTAEQIQYILSELMQRSMGDPRLHGVTITEVVIDRELQHADIYVNALGDESREEEVLAALQHAVGYLRHELAQRMQVRTMPQLHFRWDPRLAHAETVNRILDSLDLSPEEDEEVSNQ